MHQEQCKELEALLGQLNSVYVGQIFDRLLHNSVENLSNEMKALGSKQ